MLFVINYVLWGYCVLGSLFLKKKQSIDEYLIFPEISSNFSGIQLWFLLAAQSIFYVYLYVFSTTSLILDKEVTEKMEKIRRRRQKRLGEET